ncbi:LytTR family DNA-binding domain-containing protein [Thalassotalea atypica]|uniref:LytTR family DNA-binding domain-containing protein n=1 Tax=Thalassotalea atypica TaxID=2054316 RepID=UPI00257301B6|nr:LytTR family DNA-binding domain-containing protein [Thalassotalea atypica]
MNKWLYLGAIFWVVFLGYQSPVFAQSLISVDSETVIVCPAKPDQKEPPTFLEIECQQLSLYKVDPQNTELWLKANLTVSQAYMKRQQPSALFVFAKMSSEVYLNGLLLGNNGTPSFLEKDEYSGDMDARFYVPSHILKQGENEVIVHASSHNGFLSLAGPIHFIGVSEYTETGEFFKRDMLISISLLGAMLLGCVYLIAITLRTEEKNTTILILLMLTASSGQLFLEISRVLFNYSYPLHDVRLVAIVAFSLVFGLSFLLFSLYKFTCKNKAKWLVPSVSLTLLLTIMTPGFDGKSAMAILVPALFSALLSVAKYRQERSNESFAYTIIYGLFAITILLTFADFHSMYFYYIVTAMLAFLVVSKTNEFAHERSLRKAEQQQVLKLQLKLEQLEQQKSPSKLKLTSAGKIEFIAVHEISFCKAAGDYVEIHLTSNRQSLFSGTLKSLESQLPATFMKVHRSFIVNLDEVIAISSSKTGSANTAFLLLTTGDKIPVSRRILPHVRDVVKGAFALSK